MAAGTPPSSTPMNIDGRWQGRLTSRELPWEDPSIDALSETARQELAQHWLSRGAFERRVGAAFAKIHETLVADGADPALSEIARRAVDDEDRHAEISRLVASRYAGVDLADPERLPLSVPVHPGVSPSLRRTLHIVGQCALNETFASSVLEASFAACEGALAKAAIRELLSDEVDHARIGWAHLGALTPDEKRQLDPFLLPLVRINMKTWLETSREYPTDDTLVSHGALSIGLLKTALHSCVRDVLIPGFAHVGLRTDELERWYEQGAPTA